VAALTGVADTTQGHDPARLVAALQNALDQPVVLTRMQRLTAGATKHTWLVDVTVQGKPERFVLQTLPSARLAALDTAAQRTFKPEQDSRISQLARSHGVPVPEIVLQLDASQGLGHGQISRFVAGETLAPKILRDARYAGARQRLTGQCAQALATIHHIPTDQANFLPVKDAASEWQDNRAQVDASGLMHPALEWGLRWVQERLGSYGQVTLHGVHGDFRLGNFIVNDDGLAAVIDWELAHLGDPAQDLAWLCLRTWRFGGPHEVAGFGQRSDLYAAYERHCGKAVDERRLFFWEMACQLRWAVMCLGMGLGLGAPREASTRISLEHRLIGRRMEEPLWDMIQLAKARGDAA
jgi:aminoglycoside phosphotransferase (APT) family kinase protein